MAAAQTQWTQTYGIKPEYAVDLSHADMLALSAESTSWRPTSSRR